MPNAHTTMQSKTEDNMAFMEMYIYPKGRTYSADCAKCGTTNYVHPHTVNAYAHDVRALLDGGLACQHCAAGICDQETATDHGDMYAGRYSANGYMDCTDWSYNESRKDLEIELRDMYGDDESEEE